jgi:glycosyltransferase involved in cell wall biosynthesis
VLVLMTTGVSIQGIEVGGGTRHILALAKNWARSGVSVDVVTTEKPPDALTVGTGFRLHVLGETRKTPIHARFSFLLSTFMPFFVYRRRISEISTRLDQGPDDSVWIAGSPYLADVLSVLINSHKFRSAGVVYIHHVVPSPWWFPRRRGGFGRSVLNWVLFQASLALVKIGGLTPALYTPSELSKNGWHFSDAILEDGAWLEDAYRPGPLSVARRNLACFVGRVSPTKGLDDMIATWELVSREAEAELVIVGKSASFDYEHHIRRAISRARLDTRVKLYGVISDEEKRALLASAAVFLFPSYEEGWSIAVMEAAALGAIPVVYDLPAYSYLGNDLARTPVGDVGGLASVVTTILKDPRLRLELSDKLVRRMERYRGEEIADRQLAFLESLLSEGRTTRLR